PLVHQPAGRRRHLRGRHGGRRDLRRRVHRSGDGGRGQVTTNGSPLFIELGQRPDEAGPPIGGEALYPADVTARLEASAADIIARYPQSRSALLPLLHLVQAEDGYLTKAGIAFCAAQLGLTDAEVTAVATFYSMYRRE